MGTLTVYTQKSSDVYTQKTSDVYTQKRSDSAGCDSSSGSVLFVMFIACGDFCCLQITLANSLEPVQD